MQVGVIFPQTEITADPGAVRAYAETAEALGYSHLAVYDHVLGADTTNRPEWRGPYTLETLFHEPFVLFGYLAGFTRHLELVTSILILPQRQTALVAKQAAEVDVLTGGRFRLGVGLGWNDVEFQVLNEDFQNRAQRMEEQIEVLRALFTQPSVTFQGRWHRIEAAGIKPLPVQHSIPIWIGGMVDSSLRRVARLGDGWFPQGLPDEKIRGMIERLHEYARKEGRDRSTIGIEGRLSIAGKTEDQWTQEAEKWQALGATHLSVNTMDAGLRSPQEHMDSIRAVWDVVGSRLAPTSLQTR